MSKRKSATTKTSQGNSKEPKARPALNRNRKAAKGMTAAKAGKVSKQDKVIGLRALNFVRRPAIWRRPAALST